MLFHNDFIGLVCLNISTNGCHSVPCVRRISDIKVGMEYKPIKIKVPFEFVGMDLIGKLVKTDQNNQYSKCLYTFNIYTQVCKILGIRRSLCVPYHPQTNRALRKLVDEKPNNWDMYLDAVMFGLRTKRQLTTQFSPFFLMFGREARYPAEVPENYQVDGSFEDVLAEEEVAIDIERQDKIMNIVQENVEGVQERTRRRLQSKIPQQNLQMISKSYATTVEKKMCKMKKANVGNKGKDKTTLQSGSSVTTVHDGTT
ncbi:hypothetical protein SRHO_G00038680 [Serrasalmus rhombeus]